MVHLVTAFCAVPNLSLLLVELLFLLLGIGQWALWCKWRACPELAWMGSSFVAFGVGMVLQMLSRDWPLLWSVLAFTSCYLLGVVAIAQALAKRLQVAVSKTLTMALVVGVMMAQTWFAAAAPNLSVRVAVLSMGAMLVMGLPLLYWHRMQPRNRYDRALRWMYVLSITWHLVRTFVQLPSLQAGNPSEFMASSFWAVIQIGAVVNSMGLAGCLAVAVIHDVLQQLQWDRNTDALTQLLNRRGWQARLAQLQAAPAATITSPHCLLVADIDHFKCINDRWGHAVGDMVLQQVAHVLQAQVRVHDVVCRHGGEEFVLLLVGTPLSAGQQVAERMRQRLEQASIPPLQGHELTLSVGVAPLATLNPADVAEALAAADTQLYAAKSAGRNRVAVAPPLQSTESIAL